MSPAPADMIRVEQPLLRAVLDNVHALVGHTGILLPSILVVLAVLCLMYPDRVAFSPPRNRKELAYLPGYPLIGNLIEMMKLDLTKQLEFHLEQFKHSPYGYQISIPKQGTGSIIMLHRPEYIEYVQKTNFGNYIKGENFRQRFKDFLGSTGIFVADGHAWKTQRKMASHIFSVYQFRTWVQTVVHHELESAISLLDTLTERAESKTGGPATIRLPDLFFRYTLNSFGKMAFAKDIECLTADPSCLDKEVKFAAAFDHVQEAINNRFLNPFWPILERVTKEGRRTRRNVAAIREFGLDIVDERLKERESGGASAGTGEKQGSSDEKLQQRKEGKDLLDLFMDLTTDREELLEVVLNFIIAGRDTTASSLAWLFYELFRHPEYVDQIRNEVRSVLRDESDGSLKLLPYEQLKDLPFTTAVFNETIRLHPPVPRNGKTAVKDDVIVPQGPTAAGLPPIKVYAGEQIGWCDWAIARCTDVWGPDAAEFRPERFLEVHQDGTKSVKNYGQWKFHVFNGGPRLCLGMTLATYEALAWVAAVIDRYDFGWATEEQGQQAHWPLRYKNSVTHPSEMYTATVVKR
ncbi:uncharacterized protein PFL1_00486 [Pseudozyma flocculosa PF-1]|uniref:Related to Cytochrome P450 n=1 Tax=Pseudozyma flocculosa TaxID=84751 RepID=A0A5C3ESQ5_9BASI|nr:uncharacterized protein PFL1_00486 [Pseudozyma flocculosa PF-1]EPQ32289.1 hypothetical protein PFL1_00486 [Pseudozyma flocculosa PF-1]SPO34755.1 related to Cytochrome P450 [Pseudozyma flocculosa]